MQEMYPWSSSINNYNMGDRQWKLDPENHLESSKLYWVHLWRPNQCWNLLHHEQINCKGWFPRILLKEFPTWIRNNEIMHQHKWNKVPTKLTLVDDSLLSPITLRCHSCWVDISASTVFFRFVLEILRNTEEKFRRNN